MKTMARALFALMLSQALLASCGGAEDVPPKPLATHFDDMYIAQIALDQKQAMVTSQQDWSVARMEKAKAEADLTEATLQADVAKNELTSRRLELDSARKTKAAADKSADANKIAAAAKDLSTAELLEKAAATRLAYLDGYVAWLKLHQRYTEENTYWREAQFELAKANVAQKANITPKGFVHAQYGLQETERAKRAGLANQRAKAAHATAAAKRDAWKQIQTQADTAKGAASSYPDPMAAPQPAAPAAQS